MNIDQKKQKNITKHISTALKLFNLCADYGLNAIIISLLLLITKQWVL